MITSRRKVRIFLSILILLLELAILPFLITFLDCLISKSSDRITISFGTFIEGLILAFSADYIVISISVTVLVVIFLVYLWSINLKIGQSAMITKYGTPVSAGHGEYGTARFLYEREKKRIFKQWDIRKPLKKGGIIFGADIDGKSEIIWLDDGDVHSLIIGTTRSGKSRRLILPTIWELSHAGESIVVTDPKGELYAITSDYLKKQGYDIICINLRDPAKGNRWSMMDLINKAVINNDIAQAMERVWDLTAALTKRPAGSRSSEPIWENGEQATIAGLILLVALGADFDKQKHMASVYNLLVNYIEVDEEGNSPLTDLFNELPPLHPAKQAFAAVLAAHPKTRASYYTSALSTLRLFSDPNIAFFTAESDHNLQDIGLKKTAVYLIVPDDRSTRYMLATLYLDQLYAALVDLALQYGGRLPIRVNMLLDEFGNLPAIPDFDQKITVSAGRGIRYNLVVQDFAMLKKHYDKNAQTIMGNCHNWIYLLTADNDTAKQISERLGKYTVSTYSSSSSVQSKGHSVSAGMNLAGRPLLQPDELTRWDVEIQGSILLRVKSLPATFKLPDLSAYRANRDFGLTGREDADREIIMKRENAIKSKAVKQPMYWFPDILPKKKNNEEGDEQVQEYKDIAKRDPDPVISEYEQQDPHSDPKLPENSKSQAKERTFIFNEL